MTTYEMLRDLLLHQAWADREMLTAIAADANASENERIRERLQHAHAVQRAFLSLAKGEPLDVPGLQRSFDSIAHLVDSVTAYHDDVAVFIQQRGEEHLNDRVHVPWFSDADLTLEQVLMQVVMHSQYHRGQNATALRDLGRDPPLTDFIVWLSRGKPAG